MLPVKINYSAKTQDIRQRTKTSDIPFGIDFSRTCQSLIRNYADEIYKGSEGLEILSIFRKLKEIDAGLNIDAWTVQYQPTIEIFTQADKNIVIRSTPENFCDNLLRLLENPFKLARKIDDDVIRKQWKDKGKSASVDFWVA